VKGAAFRVLNDKPSVAVQPQPEPSELDTSDQGRPLTPGAASA
jgi:hypothetical protein